MVTLAELIVSKGLTKAAFAREIGCDKSYLTHVLAKRKTLGRPVAIRIFDKYGIKLGPIADLSDEDIANVERLMLARPAA